MAALYAPLGAPTLAPLRPCASNHAQRTLLRSHAIGRRIHYCGAKKERKHNWPLEYHRQQKSPAPLAWPARSQRAELSAKLACSLVSQAFAGEREAPARMLERPVRKQCLRLSACGVSTRRILLVRRQRASAAASRRERTSCTRDSRLRPTRLNANAAAPATQAAHARSLARPRLFLSAAARRRRRRLLLAARCLCCSSSKTSQPDDVAQAARSASQLNRCDRSSRCLLRARPSSRLASRAQLNAGRPLGLRALRCGRFVSTGGDATQTQTQTLASTSTLADLAQSSVNARRLCPRISLWHLLAPASWLALHWSRCQTRLAH